MVLASPSPTDVRQQLDRILASPSFVNAERASRFLRYVVERALAGESDGLKEYAIGVDVFDRGEGYDPRVDSIVRVEAGRLRSKVDEYYAGPGKADPLVIRLRRGGYAPRFEYRTSPMPASLQGVAGMGANGNRARRVGVALAFGVLGVSALVAFRGGFWPTVTTSSPIRIVVLPFAHFSTEQADRLLADRIADGVTAELARAGTLSVVSRTSATQLADARTPLKEIAQTLNAELVMEGSVSTEKDHVVVNVRLVRASLDRKFWVEDFVGTTSELPDLQRRIAASAAVAALSSRLP